MQKVRSLLIIASTFLFSTLPTKLFAQTKFINASDAQQLQKSGLGTATPQTIIANVIGVVLGFLAFVAVILILYAGFTWMTAAGNDDKVAQAKTTLISAVIGLLIILAAWGITLYVFGQLETATGAQQPQASTLFLGGYNIG